MVNTITNKKNKNNTLEKQNWKSIEQFSFSEEEYDELVEYVKGKWDYDEENLDWVVDTAIDAGKSILMLINMKK